jgi:hypothetical protein
MSAIFDFSSLITVLLLLICTCTYLRELRPAIFDPAKVSHVCCLSMHTPDEITPWVLVDSFLLIIIIN